MSLRIPTPGRIGTGWPAPQRDTDVIHMMRSPGINPPPPAQSPQADANGMNGEGEYCAGI